MVYIADIPSYMDNRLLFKNNLEYVWTRIIQNIKMIKESIAIFLTYLDLVLMQEYLSYKNVDNIWILLTELLYNKITW